MESTVVVSGLQLFAALLLVALNGLFVAAEFAFVKIRTSKVEEMVQGGKASASIVKEAIGNLDGYLAVCQLGITIASLGLGALGEPAIATLIEPLLEPFGISEGTLCADARYPFGCADGTKLAEQAEGDGICIPLKRCPV